MSSTEKESKNPAEHLSEMLETFGNAMSEVFNDPKLKEKILGLKTDLKNQAEQEIISRLEAIRRYLRNPGRDPHLSMEEIFKKRPTSGLSFKGAWRDLIKSKKKRRQQPEETHI